MSLSLQAGSNLERIYIISLSNVRRRLQNPEHQTAGGGERYSWQVRYDEDEIPSAKQVGNVYASDNQGHIDENAQEDRGRSYRDAGASDRTDDESSGRDGTAQG